MAQPEVALPHDRIRRLADGEPRLAIIHAYRALATAALETAVSLGIAETERGANGTPRLSERLLEALRERGALPGGSTADYEQLASLKQMVLDSRAPVPVEPARRYVDLALFLADRFRELAAQPPSEPAATG